MRVGSLTILLPPYATPVKTNSGTVLTLGVEAIKFIKIIMDKAEGKKKTTAKLTDEEKHAKRGHGLAILKKRMDDHCQMKNQ